MEPENDDCSLIFREYGVVKKILSFLSAKELKTVEEVCKLWNTIAKRIVNQRTLICYNFLPSFNDVLGTNLLGMRDVLDNLWSKPTLCIAFMTTDDATKPTDHQLKSFEEWKKEQINTYLPSELKWKMDHGNYDHTFNSFHLRKFLPRSCVLVGGFADSVIGTKWGILDAGTRIYFSDKTISKNSGDRPIEPFLKTWEEFPGVGFFCIPNRRGVSFRLFHYGQKEIVSKLPIDDTKLNLEEHDRVKCLVLFGNKPRHCASVVNSVVNYISDRENGEVAVGGAFADALLHPNIPDKSNRKELWGLAFCESKLQTEKRIESASVIIPYNVSDEQEIENIILKLKACGLSGKETIAFMMACVGRGSSMHNETGLESRIFRKHFPVTPLIGIFGSGEIGLNYLPECASPSNSKRRKSEIVDCLHSYSTVFVLVSFL